MVSKIARVLFLVLIVSSLSHSQLSRQDSIWKPFKFFMGNWSGKGGGQPGEGNYERSYESILNGKFVEVKNRSTYPPSEKYPNGEIHQDIGYISYDKMRKTFVLRQFHAEGFVNQFRLESISADGKNIVFISEAIENIPAGWRARETYQILGDHEFKEMFELAEPNKEFEVYSTVTLQRTD